MKKYLKSTFIYLGAPVLRNLVVLATMPLLTSYLTPEDYGKSSLVTMITSFTFSLFSLNIFQASHRFYFKYQNEQNKLREMLSSNLLIIILMHMFGLIGLYFSMPLLNKILIHGQISFSWILLMCIAAVLTSFNGCNQIFLQNQYKSLSWGITEILATIVQYTALLILVIHFKFKFEAIFLSSIAAELTKFCVSIKTISSLYTLTFNKKVFRESLTFTIPLIPLIFINYGLGCSDRLTMGSMNNVNAIGLIDISVRIALILKFILDGIGGVVSPITMQCLEQNTKQSLDKLAELSSKILFLYFLSGLALILFSEDILTILTHHKFHAAKYILPLYIFYHLFGAIGQISFWFLRYPGKTKLILYISILSLVINILINALLVKQLGVFGVALGLAIASGITTTLQYFLGLKYIKCPINNKLVWGFFTYIICCTIGVYGLHDHLTLLWQVPIKVAAICSCIIFGWHYVFQKEIKQAISFLHKK